MAKQKYLSEGGAQALMIICGIVLLLLLWCNALAMSCGCFACIMLILLPYMMGDCYDSYPGFGLVAGAPGIVGFFAHPGVFFASAFFMWCLLVGLMETGEPCRALNRSKRR